MKNKIMIAGTISLLLLSACGNENSDTAQGSEKENKEAESQQSTTKDDQSKVSESQQITTNDKKETDGEIHTSTDDQETTSFMNRHYTKDKMNVEYPQLSNEDSEKAKRINGVITKDATYFFEHGLYDGYSGEIKYDTTLLNDEIASFTYQGLITSPNQSYPVNLFYSTIVNLQTGKKERLRDLVTVDDKFVKAFKEGKILSTNSSDYSEEIKKYLSTLTNEELASKLSQADEMEASTAFTYLTDDSIVVALGVPHALGDFVQVKIAKGHINLN